MLNFVLLGPPGAGKGTQSAVVAAERKMDHVSTGEMLRVERASGSELGRAIGLVMDNGGLVDDGLILEVVTSRIRERLGKCTGFLFDGFPRTLIQAERLDSILKKEDLFLTAAIHLYVEDDALVERLSGRYSCSKCGATYHRTFSSTKIDSVCDVCDGTDFIVRSDDSLGIVQERLKSYHAEVSGIMSYYDRSDRLWNVNANKSPNEVKASIDKLFAER